MSRSGGMEWHCLVAGAVLGACLVGILGAAGQAGQVRMPLSVRQFADVPTPLLPVWTGVPLPRGAVKDPAVLRLLDDQGQAVPAQFDVTATWADGSIKWVLVSFFATGAKDKGQPFTLVDDSAVEPPKHANPLDVFDDTNEVIVTTGPMRFRLTKHGFGGFSQVWLDINFDGKYGHEERITNEDGSDGIVAVDAQGRTFTSRAGRVGDVVVERNGPLHAVVAVKGDLRGAEGGEPLLNYALRVHAFAGSTLARCVLTVHNPRAMNRPEDGSRFVLGQAGTVLLKSLDFRIPVKLSEGLGQVTLSPEPGKMLDRIPLTGPMSVYQDSSGGENWFHRAHVNRDNVIPLRSGGYQVFYHDRQVASGPRATPWIDVADMRWAVSVATPLFWQNFPKALGVDTDGRIRVGLWPKEFADLHEIQGGEEKTHEFWVYFRHRRAKEQEGRRRRDSRLLPLDRELMPACLERPIVWAAAEAYANGAGDLDPTLPVQPGRFGKYEAVVAAAVKYRENLFTHREEVDEYGWRHFGDTWAANERNQTQGPHQGLRVVSHYNNEYDLGFGMVLQGLRNADADPKLAKAWWDLGTQALWHEADIDIYHTRQDRSTIYNGGTFTHTAHGVEAGRSTHRGSPTDELWGLLDWEWQRGSSPEAGHFRTRGILLAYLLTGDRHLRDAAQDMTDLIEWKINNNRFPQIDIPDRQNGNNLQVLMDAYLLTWDERYLKPIETLLTRLDFDAFVARAGRASAAGAAWSRALFIKSVGRWIDVLKEKGKPYEKIVESYLKYARVALEEDRAGSARQGTWSYLASEVMMQAAEVTPDPAERAKFIEAGKAAFHALDSNVAADGTVPFWTSKSTTMLLQGGGRYMIHATREGAEPPEPQQP